MQFDFMPERGTIHAVFILRRMQEEYRTKLKKLYMCFVELEKALGRVPWKVLEWTLRKLYARERNNSCCVYLEKDARRVSY